MLHSARDEKGKAQESIGSWAFPSCPAPTGHLPSNQKQDVRSSDKVLRNRQLSSSELGENRVISDMPRAHIHIYVFLRFCVYILMCSRTNTPTHSHIYIQICFCVLMRLCIYNRMKIWPLLFSLQMCHIHSENRVTYSISDPRGVSPDCKMCVRDTNMTKKTYI